MISGRDANTGGGNYAENIGGHYIQANQVVINPPPATTRTETLAPSHENNGCAKRLAFAIAGTVDQADEAKLQAILQLLRKLAGDDSIEIVDIQKGSIKLILSGSPEGLEKLNALFEAGELTEVLDIPVETVQFVEPENSGSKDVQENISKSRLIEAIKTERIRQDLRGRDLSGADLSGAILSGAILSSTNLSGANLSGAILRNADLRNADLRNADLSGAILSGAILSGAILSGAILSDARLYGADLNGAILIDANLTRANLSSSILSHFIRNGGKLTGVNLSGAILTRANLSGANLSGAILSNADLSNADLSGAILTRAILSDAKVTETTFIDCIGISTVEKAILKRRGAIFNDAPGDRSATHSLTPR